MDKKIEQPFISNPVLIDKAIQALREKLLGLSWLDKAFGRAYKIVECESSGNKYTYPSAYIGNAEYVSLMPNDEFGNFCWFDIYDPQIVSTKSPMRPMITFSGAIVFWFNLESIFIENDVIKSEEIKNEILKILTNSSVLQHGRISITNIYERLENIYKGYSLERVYNNYAYKGESINSLDKQYFMYPYGGLRFEFEITIQELCN